MQKCDFKVRVGPSIIFICSVQKYNFNRAAGFLYSIAATLLWQADEAP